MPIQISCLYFIFYFLLIKLNGYSLVTGWPHSKPNHPPPDGTTEGCSHEEHWKNVGRSIRRSPRGKFWSRNLLESLMGSIYIVWKGVFYGFSDWITRKWNHGMRKGTSLRVLTNTVKNISRTKSFPVGRVVVVVVVVMGEEEEGLNRVRKCFFSRSFSNACKWSSRQMTVGHQLLVGNLTHLHVSLKCQKSARADLYPTYHVWHHRF